MTTITQADLAWINSALAWINSYAAFVKFKQWAIQITSDKRFKREMMEGFEVFHYIWREYLRRRSPYWAEKPPSCWMDMLRAKLILAGNQVGEIWAPAVCFEHPAEANDAHQRYDSYTADTVSCEPSISDEQIPQMGNGFSWTLLLSQLQLHLARLLENVCWNSVLASD